MAMRNLKDKHPEKFHQMAIDDALKKEQEEKDFFLEMLKQVDVGKVMKEYLRQLFLVFPAAEKVLLYKELLQEYARVSPTEIESLSETRSPQCPFSVQLQFGAYD